MSQRKAIVDAHNSRTAIRVVDGKIDYPSTRGKGWEQITYQRRTPMVGGKVGELKPATIKMRELPFALVRDLNSAHREGQLREELGRHLAFLETNEYVDKGTLRLLHSFEGDLRGHYEHDGEVLKHVNEVLHTLRPEPREP